MYGDNDTSYGEKVSAETSDSFMARNPTLLVFVQFYETFNPLAYNHESKNTIKTRLKNTIKTRLKNAICPQTLFIISQYLL